MQSELSIGPLRLRSAAEHLALGALRRGAFTPWVDPLPSRAALNAASLVLEGFLLEARLASGALVGFLFSVPGHWSGAAGELQTYDYHRGVLTQRPLLKALLFFAGALRGVGGGRAARSREALERAHLRGSNAAVLLAILVEPAQQGRGVSARLIEHLRAEAARRGYRALLSPFRPVGYGRYKRESGRAHSAALFAEYCASTEAGLPRDPWLRALTRLGMRPLRAEPRSLEIVRALRVFEGLRSSYHPERWYQPAANTWECGEVPTWYTDPYAQRAISVEPNLWGEIPV